MNFEIELRLSPFLTDNILVEYDSLEQLKAEFKDHRPIESITCIDDMPYKKWFVEYTLTTLSGNYQSKGETEILARTKVEAQRICKRTYKTDNEIVNWAYATEIKQ